MTSPLLATKLYAPDTRIKTVPRERLIEQLTNGMYRKLTLVSAPAGFGKTTLLSQWLASVSTPAAWLSLDEGDRDPARFLHYLVAAIKTVTPVDDDVMSAIRASQASESNVLMTLLLNNLNQNPQPFILVLDDYHLIDNQNVDKTLEFFLEYLPAHVHMVLVTREDPLLPLARLRVRDQLTELRVNDLRFTPEEAAAFMRNIMNVNISAEHVQALESRTEGWIAGLQMAALSMQGHQGDMQAFITSFTGSHRYVLDYLLEEVLHQQPDDIQTFLLATSILERLSGPLCDAILECEAGVSQGTLGFLERANLFMVPLDNERRWFRYHHLFAELLKQRLQQSVSVQDVYAYHQRASEWFEANGYEVDAFQHAAASQDIARTVALIEGNGMPLHFRGAAVTVRNWLDTLDPAVMNDWPILWTTYASVTLVGGDAQNTEPKLQAAETSLQTRSETPETRDLQGRIAAIRATLAAEQRNSRAIIEQSRVALELLHADNVPFRTSTLWKLGFAYQLEGKREAAREAFHEVITIGEASGNVVFTRLALVGLGVLQEEAAQLLMAGQTFARALEGTDALPLTTALLEARVGLARVYYEQNALAEAEAQLAFVARRAWQLDHAEAVLDAKILQAHVHMARGDLTAAQASLDDAQTHLHTRKFTHCLPDLMNAQVRYYLQGNDLNAAKKIASEKDTPLGYIRVLLASGASSKALSSLGFLQSDYTAKDMQKSLLTVCVLKALAVFEQGDHESALALLNDALVQSQAQGIVRPLLDEGARSIALLRFAATWENVHPYVTVLLDVTQQEDETPQVPTQQMNALIEPLSERELEVLRLIAEGLSNREISKRMFRALDTIKGHNRNIFSKLQVQNRTQAVARARELNLL